ncbi:STE3-domain-containing protein [Daedalea quercina L-15889]|uniref:STE3-domain-containing protein n=1 Tax=Daedalea quercina L-15889 TaxID=1314783 RepID=A0A165QFI9_9APHY|nr:STE3-domain-containing protein [Daedalea quercina L-15889]
MPVALPLGSFIAAILVLIPLPSHIKAQNLSTVAMVLWLFAVNVAQGINSIIWMNNVEVKLVVWCDIVTRLFIGSNTALPAACFSLCMHLERIASARAVLTTNADKRKRVIVDSVLCFGVPAIYVGLYYAVQGHRFDLVETIGCRPETYVSIPEFFLIRFPPIFLSLGASAYAALAFAHFFRRRATFAKHLQGNASALTPSRYLRLMAMAVIEMFWGLLVTAINTWFSYRDGLRPWISWANTHSDFSRIGQYPLILIPRSTLVEAYFLWWAVPVSAYLFFVFFAFGRDTMQCYVACWEWIRRFLLCWARSQSCEGEVKMVGFVPASKPSPSSSSDTAIFVKDSFYNDCSPTHSNTEKDVEIWKDYSSSLTTCFPSVPPSPHKLSHNAGVRTGECQHIRPTSPSPAYSYA